jgi:hypothetical protein
MSPAVTAKRDGWVNLEFGILNCTPAFGTMAVCSRHQPIESVVELSQTRLQYLAAALSCFYEQRLADVFAFAMQAVPYKPVFSANWNFN